jgi:hypothetical protein
MRYLEIKAALARVLDRGDRVIISGSSEWAQMAWVALSELLAERCG